MCRVIFGQYQCCQLIKGIPDYKICANNKSGEAWNCKLVQFAVGIVMSDKFVLAKRVPVMCCLCGRKRKIKKNKDKASDLLREVRKADRTRSNRAKSIGIRHELKEALISVKKACQEQEAECKRFGLLLDTLANLDMPPELRENARKIVEKVERYAKEDYEWVDDEAKAVGIPPDDIKVPRIPVDESIKEISELLKSKLEEPTTSGGAEGGHDKPNSPNARRQIDSSYK